MESSADPAGPRALPAVQQTLGDIRLAVLAAAAVLDIGEPGAASRAGALAIALLVVWAARRTPALLLADVNRLWLLTGLDLLTSILVLTITGTDSLALVYVAITAATAGLVLGQRGALVAAGAVAAVHLTVLASSGGLPHRWHLVVVVAVRLALVTLAALGAARLRELLVSREALATELAGLREDHVREQERARLAREMHDSLAKTVHGAQILARRLERRLDRELAPARADAADLVSALEVAQHESREVLDRLREERPTQWQPAIRERADRWGRSSGVTAVLDLRSPEPELPSGAGTELLKAVGELLDNVHRHARATRVLLSVAVKADGNGSWLRILITDDGVGFAPGGADRSGHYGLVGVRERLAGLGGRVRITSPAAGGAGTAVELMVPLEPAAAEPAARAGVAPASIPSHRRSG